MVFWVTEQFPQIINIRPMISISKANLFSGKIQIDKSLSVAKVTLESSLSPL